MFIIAETDFLVFGNLAEGCHSEQRLVSWLRYVEGEFSLSASSRECDKAVQSRRAASVPASVRVGWNSRCYSYR